MVVFFHCVKWFIHTDILSLERFFLVFRFSLYTHQGLQNLQWHSQSLWDPYESKILFAIYIYLHISMQPNMVSHMKLMINSIFFMSHFVLGLAFLKLLLYFQMYLPNFFNKIFNLLFLFLKLISFMRLLYKHIIKWWR